MSGEERVQATCLIEAVQPKGAKHRRSMGMDSLVHVTLLATDQPEKQSL